ncbi:MAG: hypothetical protein H6715_05940 [Myxococcales bacterium]|nr:hypothetical protein [Myxococcales bacterium]MCB9708319.1 hypothetical protein [Myxococcales bacterium]
MSKMVQIRNMPDHIHRTLKARAAQAGMTLSDYLLREAKRLASRPTLTEVLERLEDREPVNPSEGGVDALREERRSAS